MAEAFSRSSCETTLEPQVLHEVSYVCPLSWVPEVVISLYRFHFYLNLSCRSHFN